MVSDVVNLHPYIPDVILAVDILVYLNSAYVVKAVQVEHISLTLG